MSENFAILKNPQYKDIEFKYLNIGGGQFERRYDGWFNLDYPFSHYIKKRQFDRIDINFNLMDKMQIPLDDNSMEVVYSEHTFEHLPYEMCVFRFKDIIRILKPEGIFRIVVPDCRLFWMWYLDKKVSMRAMNKLWSVFGIGTKEKIFIDAVCSLLLHNFPEEKIKEIIIGKNFEEDMERLYSNVSDKIDKEFQDAYVAYHITWWDYKRLRETLESCGFPEVSRPLERNQSKHPILQKRYIDRTKVECSLRLEARKGI